MNPRSVERSRTTRTARGVGVAVMLALALTAAACSGDPSASPATPSPTTPPATSPAGSPASSATSAYGTYVALGDSYTAAPLVPDTDTANGCLRSSNNYPSLVAAAMPGTTLYDVSCSGADSTSMVGVQQTGTQAQPAQFDALTEDTDLVTVGIGGNDFNLFGKLVGFCAQGPQSDPTGSPCSTQLTSDGPDAVARDLRGVRSHLAAIVTGIRDRSPKAKVVVVGYPQLVPPTGTCPDLLPLAEDDYAYARQLNEGLAAAVKSGAKEADAYVDVFRASAGHDICSDDPWVNGSTTDTGAALAFHPFAAEQRAVAELVLAKL